MSASAPAVRSLARQRVRRGQYRDPLSLVQIEAPDDKRGRVSAINYLFVGSSNTLGEFESGAVAAWLGAVPSVLIGGFGALLIAGIWMLLFPDLRRIDRFEPVDNKPRT
jgi:hypothetical protein